MHENHIDTGETREPWSRLGAGRAATWCAMIGAILCLGCSGLSDDGPYFGQTTPPEGQHFRYISGSEPQTLDPHIGTGQPEARLYAALFEGLVIYDPETAEPFPGIAVTWESSTDNTEFTFHLRDTARWSNGDNVTAHDFVYALRRALSPELAARSTYMAYEIRNARAYNSGEVFARDLATGRFLTRADLDASGDVSAGRGAERITLAGDVAARQAELETDTRLAALVEGAELVPVTATDVGVEALDALTLRYSLVQPAPYFVGMLAHQFFMPVHEATVEQYGDQWAQVNTLVVNGPFVLKSWEPYNQLVLEKNPLYWDVNIVRLDSIRFYPMEEQTTMMNLYKAGEVDATFNHTVPPSWLDVIGTLRDYANAPENTIEYYAFNTTQPPMDDVRVRKAFNAAIDKQALASFRRTAAPLTGFTPKGIFPGYPVVEGDGFDPVRARALLADAGYVDASGSYDPSTVPLQNIELLYNTLESNRQVAEFIQAEWRQNLGITVPLRNMEWMTYLDTAYSLEYQGFVRTGWVGDYLDPFTFLGLLQAAGGSNLTGWDDPTYAAMLAQANQEQDPATRYERLAEAEAYMLEQQPIIPLMTQTTNWMKKPYVQGMYPNPLTIHSWKHVSIEHDPSLWDSPPPGE